MNNLNDDWQLNAGGETTLKFIDHYLPISIENQVNGRIICGGKTVPQSFKRNSFQPISWQLVRNTTIVYHNINTHKTKAMFGNRLRPEGLKQRQPCSYNCRAPSWA